MADISLYNDSAPAQQSEHSAINIVERPAMTAAVIRAFREGWGVEDIGVMGIAQAEYARAVLRRLTALGMIDGLMKPHARGYRE